MALFKNIPPKYHEEVYCKSQEGLGYQKISDFLNEKYNLNCTYSHVRRVMDKLRAEKQEVAQRIMVEQVAQSAAKHLSIFEEVINKFNKEITKCIKEGDRHNAKALADTMFKFQSKIMDLSGLHETNLIKTKYSEEEEEIKETILKKAGITANKNAN